MEAQGDVTDDSSPENLMEWGYNQGSYVDLTRSTSDPGGDYEDFLLRIREKTREAIDRLRIGWQGSPGHRRGA